MAKLNLCETVLNQKNAKHNSRENKLVYSNLPNIILGRDFNLPHIDWCLITVKPNPQYGKEINKKLTDIVNENDLTQVVREPTRGNNILDLMFTTNPGFISSIEVHPGMSDYIVIITDVNLKAKSTKKKPRKDIASFC